MPWPAAPPPPSPLDPTDLNMANTMKELLKRAVRLLGNWHTHDPAQPPIFVFSCPRSGSTWLTELFLSQPGFRFCNDPFDLRKRRIRDVLGMTDWIELYLPENLPRMREHLNGFLQGHWKYSFKNLLLNERHYQFRTNRMVFKILHALEDRIDWITEEFGGYTYFLIRHPIPVALSHRVAPRLPAFLNSPIADRLTPEQRSLPNNILTKGTELERKVAD